ncbi:MAG: M48 family metalloprotease [bacterium]|nr:M48 family metalloprotease [bacterium]
MKNNKIICLLMVVVMAAFVAFSGCSSLPFDDLSSLPIDDIAKGAKLVSKAAHKITEEEEYYLGRAVAANILTKYPLWKNQKMTDYVNLVGTFLSLRSERPDVFGGYHFGILDTREVNAWSAPGGIILLTRGLVNLAANEDELAAVLAHEISHIVSKDPLKAVKSERLKQLGFFAAKKAAKGDLADVLNDSVLDVTGKLLQKGYSRSTEKKADLAALDLLAAAGYNPNALLSMLEKIEEIETKKAAVFSAHPKANKRIAYTNERLKQMQPVKTVKYRTKRFKRAKS